MVCGYIVRREKVNLLAVFPTIHLIILRVMSIYRHENEHPVTPTYVRYEN